MSAFVDEKPVAAAAAVATAVTVVAGLFGVVIDPQAIVPLVAGILTVAAWTYRRVTGVPEGQRGFKAPAVPQVEPERWVTGDQEAVAAMLAQDEDEPPSVA